MQEKLKETKEERATRIVEMVDKLWNCKVGGPLPKLIMVYLLFRSDKNFSGSFTDEEIKRALEINPTDEEMEEIRSFIGTKTSLKKSST